MIESRSSKRRTALRAASGRVLLLSGLLSAASSCNRVSMVDPLQPDKPNATFHYTAVRSGATASDYSSIDRTVLTSRAKP